MFRHPYFRSQTRVKVLVHKAHLQLCRGDSCEDCGVTGDEVSDEVVEVLAPISLNVNSNPTAEDGVISEWDEDIGSARVGKLCIKVDSNPGKSTEST